MTEDKLELTRRKILASAGVVGLAGAGAGLGTSALFGDTESFNNNSIEAGELDLKVDWEEHYSFPQAYGFEDPTTGLDVTRTEPSDTSDYTALPDPRNPLVWVENDDLGTYMDNTAIESFPDSNDNRVQDNPAAYDACADFADTPADLDPTTGLRTQNADTLDQNDEPLPLVNLHDVKPGDFGELTLSFHLCDNPGYVWLQGAPVRAAENDHTEPEGDDPNETGGSDEVATGADVLDSDVELLDEVQTLLWYDDGDNVYEPSAGTEAVDLMLVFDKSESMNGFVGNGSNDTNTDKLNKAVDGAQSLVDTVGSNTQVGLTLFSDEDNSGVAEPVGNNRAAIKQDLDDLNGPDDAQQGTVVNDDPEEGNKWQPDSVWNDDDNLNAETQTESGIRAGQGALANGRSGAKKVMVILTDGAQSNPDNDPPGLGDAGAAAQDAKDAGTEIYTIAYGNEAITSDLSDWASDPEDTHAFVSSGPSDIEAVFSQLGQILGGEKAFFRGSLRELLTEVSDGDGIPLDGNRDTPFDEGSDPPDDEDREKFVNSSNHFAGFAWWVPTDVGNRIQSDSVGFDLGFYTEQARNNDGSGPVGT